MCFNNIDCPGQVTLLSILNNKQESKAQKYLLLKGKHYSVELLALNQYSFSNIGCDLVMGLPNPSLLGILSLEYPSGTLGHYTRVWPGS